MKVIKRETDMNIDYLRIFINLSETLNFSATAQAMNLSQPAISKAINRLEAELGFQLFIRSKRQVLLTESGQQFQKRIRIIVRNLDKAISEGRLIEKNYKNFAIQDKNLNLIKKQKNKD